MKMLVFVTLMSFSAFADSYSPYNGYNDRAPRVLPDPWANGFPVDHQESIFERVRAMRENIEKTQECKLGELPPQIIKRINGELKQIDIQPGMTKDQTEEELKKFLDELLHSKEVTDQDAIKGCYSYTTCTTDEKGVKTCETHQVCLES